MTAATGDALPVGKLPPDLLARLIAQSPMSDPRVRVPPGLGFDCAVLEPGPDLLVVKSDPITFATDEAGWYLVQVNANDLATTGAVPRWLLLTMLLPAGATTPELVERVNGQVRAACAALDISVVGGHTEITHGLDRVILAGTLIGEVAAERLVTPGGACVGDRLLLTKGVPIEATALLAREFPQQLAGVLSTEEIELAQGFLHDPGLSVVADARMATHAGRVTAMHDPTEGGLAGALWELAEACGHGLWVDPARVLIPPLAARVCAAFGIDPLASIASGALLLTAAPEDAAAIGQALAAGGVPCVEIGVVEGGPPGVWQGHGAARKALPRPARDEIARLFEAD
jgi:hydrogenase expression/formation protein HypE